MSVVGTIQIGFPSPKFPPITSVFTIIIGDAFNIAFVSFALNISLVKYFSNKHDYVVNSNQELFTYGLGNIVCSFFSGFPACSGLTRSLIVEGIGARTQVYSLISSVIVLITFVGIGFLFKDLPNACLAAIIVVSLIRKCFEARSVVSIFKKSKLEGLAWSATFFGVLILDIDYGLYIGLGCSFLLIIIQSQRPPASVLGYINSTEYYEDIKYFTNAKEINGLKIIRYEANIYYANVENFVYQIVKLSTINPAEQIALIQKYQTKSDKLIEKLEKKNKRFFQFKKTKNLNDFELDENVKQDKEEEEKIKLDFKIKINSILDKITIKHVILDLSCVNYIDSMGSESILKVFIYAPLY